MHKIIGKKLILLLLVFVLGGFLRFYKLQEYPIQLNHDEVSQLYDAIAIATTSKDIYGNFMPFVFESVHDYKAGFYTYATSIADLLFGGGESTVRLPGVFFGTLTILAVFIFTLKLFKSYSWAILASLLTAIAPFEIFFARKSFENGAGIFFMLLGFSALLIYLDNKHKSLWLYLGFLSLAVTMYTYFSHAILIPLLLISFLLIFKRRLGSKKSLIKPLIFWLVLIMPLLFMIATNPSTRYRSQTVFVSQDVNLGQRVEYSKTGNQFLDNLSANKATFDFSFNRFLAQFDSMYIFGFGLDLTNQGPLGMGPLMFIQLPFLFLGIIYLLRLPEGTKQKRFILAWIILGMLPSGLTFEPNSPHRSIMVFTMLNIISAGGLLWTFSHFKGVYIKTILVLGFLFNFIYFIHMYTVNFPFEKPQFLQYPFEPVSRFMWSEYNNFDHIVFDPLYGRYAPVIGTAAHYYVGYFGHYPPEKMQQEYRVGKKKREVLFDKFSIRQIEWAKDKNMHKTLIIASPWSVPIQDVDSSIIIQTFYYLDGQPAFNAIALE